MDTMKRFLFIISLVATLFWACNNDSTTEEKYVCNECSGLFSERFDIWVDNKLTQNPDNPDQKCLKVQMKQYVSDTSWVPFCDSICGFNYEPGYQYDLLIERKKIGEDSTGNPEYKYCLLYIKSKMLKPMK